MLEEAGSGVEAESGLERVRGLEDLVGHMGGEEPQSGGRAHPGGEVPTGRGGGVPTGRGGRQDWAQVYSTVHVSPV